ncbi:MAG: DnaJ domain-containing protein [Actinomycetota bacterium]|nr:DnaJ domain-containing protein [Actinomycetota bacterium]
MNYYKILEVDREASPEVIQKAYKALSMKYHPDRQAPANGPQAHTKMQSINEAYAVLSDPRKRLEYDSQTMYWRIWIDDGLIGLAKVWLSA